MSSSDYTYKIESFAGRNVLVIEDLNLGNKSVTNDIENILATVSKAEKLTPEEHMIVYMDSEGTWDGFDAKKGSFISLQEDGWRNAVRKYVQKQLTALV